MINVESQNVRSGPALYHALWMLIDFDSGSGNLLTSDAAFPLGTDNTDGA